MKINELRKQLEREAQILETSLFSQSQLAQAFNAYSRKFRQINDEMGNSNYNDVDVTTTTFEVLS